MELIHLENVGNAILSREGTFINNDSLLIHNSGKIELSQFDNLAYLINSAFGIIQLTDINSTALEINSSGTFENQGLFIADIVDSIGIDNHGELINSGSIRIRKTIHEAISNKDYISEWFYR